MKLLTSTEVSVVAAEALELYLSVKANPDYTDFYQENPEAVTVERITESVMNNLELSFNEEDLDAAIRMVYAKRDPGPGLVECPTCSKVFKRLLAVSRKDNRTMICDDCGTHEAISEYLNR